MGVYDLPTKIDGDSRSSNEVALLPNSIKLRQVQR